MVARLPVVEQLLGAPLAEVTGEHLLAAIQRELPEGPDLDFKAGHYESGDKGRAELAKDVAAFANHVGGVIVLGVGDKNGAASPCDRVELSDSLRGGMLQSLRARLAPFVPELDILPVAENGQVDRGFYLIVVGRSPRAPHAVVSGGPAKPIMQWPVRQGVSTRFLHEAELAEAYRDRFDGAARRYDRMGQIMDEGTMPLNREAGAWLTVGVVPALPGAVPLGAAGMNETQRIAAEWAKNAWDGGVLQRRVAAKSPSDYAVRLRRVAFDPDFVNSRPPQTAYIECHSDGSCAASAAVRIKRSPGNLVGRLPQVWVEAVLLELLHFVAFYAARARSSGEVRLRARLLLPEDAKVMLAETDYQWQMPDINDLSGYEVVEGGMTLPDLAVDLGDIAQIDGVARTAYLMMQDLVSAFAIPEVGILTSAGEVKPNVNINGLQAWAGREGIAV